MAKASTEIKPGDVLGEKYRVEKVIGHGGMGIVFAARHLELRQRVAIKLLPDEHLNDAELVARFLREARAAVKLKSEHAVRVMDVGRRKNGAPFIVMELLEGEDLSDVITRGPVPVAEAVDYILQACEAVAEAHALGIVHRDLKPRNLFLARRLGGRPFVKVLDFGLAKRISMDDGLTATTAVMGSPQYMSPEQMRATRNVDFRTDIWSLGVCLYELVSGRLPFDAEAVAVVCAMVLKDPHRPLAELSFDVPLDFSRVVDTCLSKDPIDRFTTISELAAALEPFAPPHAKGAGQRIAAVLEGVPPSSALDEDGTPREEVDTRTTATFDSDPRQAPPSSNRWIAAVLGVFFALGVSVAVLIFARATFTSANTVVREPTRYVPDEAGFTTLAASAHSKASASPTPSASASSPAAHGKTAPIAPPPTTTTKPSPSTTSSKPRSSEYF